MFALTGRVENNKILVSGFDLRMVIQWPSLIMRIRAVMDSSTNLSGTDLHSPQSQAPAAQTIDELHAEIIILQDMEAKACNVVQQGLLA